jgi:hypothetical protein
MTSLERLIQAHVEGAVVATVSSATEKFAEELAREWMKDPAFKADVQAIIRRHFAATVETLQTPAAAPRARGKTAGRAVGRRAKAQANADE